MCVKLKYEAKVTIKNELANAGGKSALRSDSYRNRSG